MIDKGIILDALTPIQDPDLHRSIVDLGFIKNIKIDGGEITFDLELTTPACPVKDVLKQACIDAVSALEDVSSVKVNMTARTRGAQLANREILKSVKNIIAVASGKGGVGKSTTATNLAIALNQSGARVGILDADIYGPSIPTMIRIEEPVQATSDQKLIPAKGAGIEIVSMGLFVKSDQAAALRGPMVSKYISHFLGAVEWGDLDYLIIDYPPGTGDVQLTLSQQAPITGALIVTTPQDIALVDVNRAIAMFELTKVPVLGICETMSYFVCDECGKKHYLFKSGGGKAIAEKNGVPFLGGIPIDPQVTISGDEGSPIVLQYPDSPIANIYREIAGKLAAQLSIINVERGKYLETFTLDWKQA